MNEEDQNMDEHEIASEEAYQDHLASENDYHKKMIIYKRRMLSSRLFDVGGPIAMRLVNYLNTEDTENKDARAAEILASEYLDWPMPYCLLKFLGADDQNLVVMAAELIYHSTWFNQFSPPLTTISDKLIPDLFKCLTNESKITKVVASTLLREVRPIYSREALHRIDLLFAVPDEDPDVLEAAAKTKQLLLEKYEDYVETLDFSPDGKNVRLSIVPVTSLLDDLKSQDKEKVLHAIHEFGVFGTGGAILHILELRNTKLWELSRVREEVVLALDKIGTKNASRTLGHMLDDRSKRVRKAALKALDNSPYKEFGFEIAWFESKRKSVSQIASKRLMEFYSANDRFLFTIEGKWDEKITSIVQRINLYTNGTNKDPEDLEKRLRLISDYHDPRLLYALGELLQASNNFESKPELSLLCTACKILGEYRKHASKALLDLAERFSKSSNFLSFNSSDFSYSLLSAIDHTELPECVDVLFNFLVDYNTNSNKAKDILVSNLGRSQIKALSILRKMDDCANEIAAHKIGHSAHISNLGCFTEGVFSESEITEAKDLILKGLESKWLPIRIGCIDSFFNGRDLRAVPKLRKLALNSEFAQERVLAIEMLGILLDTENIDVFRKALSDNVQSVRETAATALGEMKSPLAAEPLINLFNSLIDSIPRSGNLSLDQESNSELCLRLIDFIAKSGGNQAEEFLTSLLSRNFSLEIHGNASWSVRDTAAGFFAAYHPASFLRAFYCLKNQGQLDDKFCEKCMRMFNESKNLDQSSGTVTDSSRPLDMNSTILRRIAPLGQDRMANTALRVMA